MKPDEEVNGAILELELKQVLETEQTDLTTSQQDLREQISTCISVECGQAKFDFPLDLGMDKKAYK